MKRDLDFLREILLRAEDAEYGELKTSDFREQRERIVAEHFLYLAEAGFAEINPLTHEEIGIQSATLLRLTNDGHEFLDSIRNASVWEKIKERALRQAGVLTLTAVTTAVKVFVQEGLGAS